MNFKVSGRIYEAESGLGIPNLVVEAFDKDPLKSDELGQTKTNSNGNFEISYTEADFKGAFELFEGNPDLYIVVKSPDRSKILYTSQKNIRSEATTDEYFDVAIPKTSLISQEKVSKNDKELLKILIGVAWIDGVLEPKEREFLQRAAKERGLADDAEIKALLSDNQPVQPEECYRWLQAYLGEYPSDTDVQELYEAFNTLASSDRMLDTKEKERLNAQEGTPANSPQNAIARRFTSILMDSKFLARVQSVGRSSTNSAIAKVAGYYARVPYRILSSLSTVTSNHALANELTQLYLTDNFAPIKQEITADDLTVIGELPDGLSGMFLRNGPNPQISPIGLYHWFDGDGMLHGVRISHGKASYRNRYIRTEGFKQEETEGKAIWPGLLNLPRFDTPHGMMIKNTANTSCVWHAGKLLALWDGGEPYLIRLPDLETVGMYTFNGKLAANFTAHPKIDPVTGEMIGFTCAPLTPPHLEYNIISAKGELVRSVPIDLPEPVLINDFAITENYTIFLDLPLTFNPRRIVQGQLPIKFKAQKPSRIGILPRHGDNRSIRWFEIPSCMVYHVASAYEQAGDEIVLIAARTPHTNFFVPDEGKGEGGDSESELFRLYRWVIDLTTGIVKQEPVSDIAAIYPRINDRLTGRRIRYVYASRQASYMRPRPLGDGLIKYDLRTGSYEMHEFARGQFGGDSVFVPRPGGIAEDDGWLLTLIWDAVANKSELLVIDARNFTSEPVARVIIPQRVPYGLHATWVSDAQMANQRS